MELNHDYHSNLWPPDYQWDSGAGRGAYVCKCYFL